MPRKQKLANPLFIIAVLALILNDWYFKYAFHNPLTGKVSDVAGLFAFPFFLSAFWPERKKIIYTGTALLFIIWKSPLMQPLIDALHPFGIPVNRVVDYGDYWALAVLPLSFFTFDSAGTYRLKPVLLNFVIAFAALSFVATTMPKGKYTKFREINKTYSFNFSKRELVSRVNSLQLEYVKDIENLVHTRNGAKGMINPDTARIDFDSKNNLFYYSTTFSKKDTIARILDYEQLKDLDTIQLRTMHSDINISGNGNHSELKLINLVKYVGQTSKDDEKEKAISIFEQYVIKKIKKYGK